MGRVVVEVNNVEGKILTPLNIDQLSVISSICSFKVENSEYKSSAFKNRGRGSFDWDGYRRLFNVQTQKFPIGLLPKIMDLFNTVGLQTEVIDKRVRWTNRIPIVCTPREQRKYQNDVVFSSILNGNGIVKAATGSGKTTMAGLTISAMGRSTVFIVHTKDLLYQAKESFQSMLDVTIGQIGDGIVDLDHPVVVATVQTLSNSLSKGFYEKYTFDEDLDEESEPDLTNEQRLAILKWAKSVGMVLFDEVQRVGSRTAYEARFMFSNADSSFGYSASPWRDDGSDLMIEAAFGPRICDITATRLIGEGYLVQPTIEVKRMANNIWDGKNYSTVYKTGIVENMFRNMQIVTDAIEYYNRQIPTLILVVQVKHGKILQDMIRGTGYPAQFISGASNMKYRKQVIEDMRKGKAPLVIASTIADVGLDVPRLGAIVEAGAGKSSVTALQRLGRIMRLFPGKTECFYRTYRDMAPFICRHIDRKIDIWRTEPAFIIKEVD